MQSSTMQRLVLAVILVSTIWYGFYLIQPPNAKPATTPATAFSAERAFEHVRQIAQKPHPLGSAANDSVRTYLIQKLQQLGINPIIQEGIGSGGRTAGYTKNVIGKINGRDPEHTLLLMAHYDSVPNAPGAADDAAGVAAILETIRAIQSRESPLKNNLWLLFTDGEERGLLGARLFTSQFSELQQIDLVLNFEARGTTGPSMMFETSAPNGKLIPHFAKATPRPVANSLMYTVYQMLPNDTDLTVIKEAGLKGFNFAFTKEYLNYHTMQDNPENLSPASLQHHGSNMLGNVLYFGNKSFSLDSTTEYVYFNNATGGLSYYPASWSLPIALFTALLFIGYLIYLFRTNRLSLGKYLGSILLFVGITAIGAGITYLGWQGFKLLHPQYDWLVHGETYRHHWYFWGFTLLTLTLFSSVYSWFQQKMTIQQLLSGSYTLWILLSLGSAWYLPSASYILSWPVLLALAGWIILGDTITAFRWKSTLILGLSLTAVLFLVPPYIHQVQIMMTTEMLWVSIIQLLLVLGLVWPLVWQIIRDNAFTWNTGIALAAAVCFVSASVTSGYNASHKKQNNINFVQNLDTKQAYWISQNDTVDSWTRQFLGTDFQQGSIAGFSLLEKANFIHSAADLSDLPQPQFNITTDSSNDSLRFISLQLDTRENGLGLIVEWNDQSALTQLGIHGKSLFDKTNSTSSERRIVYFQDLSQIVDLNLTYRSSADPPELTFTFLKQGLPTYLISDYRDRPPHMMPSPAFRFLSDATIWQYTLILDKQLTVK